jgi:hypothetical protein
MMRVKLRRHYKMQCAKLQDSLKGKPILQRSSFDSAKAFVEKAKPYVKPLLASGKILLELIAL